LSNRRAERRKARDEEVMMREIMRIRSVAILCAAFALTLIAATPSQAAHRGARAHARGAEASSGAAAPGGVLVLEAGGHMLKNGQFVNVNMSIKPEFSFTAFVTIEGTSSPAEVEIECENFLEQGKINFNPVTDVWRVLEPHPITKCEGAPWLELALIHNHLMFAPPNIATDSLSIELMRSPEAVEAEERKQAEKFEEADPREPLVCEYVTTANKGKFGGKATGKKLKPLEAKIKGKVALVPRVTGAGCGLKKAKWKSSYTLTAAGGPVFPVFEAPPSVSGVSPHEGPEAGGTSVNITGAGLSGATGVKFGAKSASFKVNSASSITATAPPGAGTVDVTVETPIGTSAANAGDHYTYLAPPTVTEISPKVGPPTGGTEVTITGTNFTPGSTVMFGTAAGTNVKVNSETSITATSPEGSGTVPVTVTTAGGTSAMSAADEFTY
jgi:IPT/TIG domain